MALKPETKARIQGILDGTIKAPTEPSKPADLSSLLPETQERIRALLSQPIPSTPTPTIQTSTPMPQQPDAQELRNADSVIEALAQNGHGDYSDFRTEIALDIYTNGHYNGHWDATFFPTDYDQSSTLSAIRVIQEDEYDQHMSEDERPDEDDMVAEVNNGYLFIN